MLSFALRVLLVFGACLPVTAAGALAFAGTTTFGAPHGAGDGVGVEGGAAQGDGFGLRDAAVRYHVEPGDPCIDGVHVALDDEAISFVEIVEREVKSEADGDAASGASTQVGALHAIALRLALPTFERNFISSAAHASACAVRLFLERACGPPTV